MKKRITLHLTKENQSKNINKLCIVIHRNDNNHNIKELKQVSDVLIDIIHENFSSNE